MSLQKGLVGHWTMDSRDTDNGVIRDRSGYENHGNIQGPLQGQTGIVGESFEWNGNGDTINISKSGELDITDSITLSIWTNLNSDTDDNGNTSHHFYSNDYGLIHGNFFVENPSNSNREGVSPALSADGNWHHAVMTFDGNTVTSYIDGSETNTLDYTGKINNGDNELQIGNAGGDNFTTDGKLDDARVYNRALSDSEVNALYQLRNVQETSSRGFPVAAGNLVARYPFRDGSARDDARNANYADPTAYDGTIGGALYRSKEGHTSDGGFDFTGSDTNDIKFPNDAVQTGNSTRTTMGWFKVENDTGNRQMGFGSANGNSGEAWEMEVYGVYNGSGTTFGALGIHTWSGYNKTNADVISLNEWVHFAATHDGNPSNIQIYLNGEPIPTENDNVNSSSLNTSSAFHRSGYSEGHSVGEHTFSGQATDLRIYNKDLSDSEIRTIYQNTRPQISASGGSTITTETINGEQYRIHAFENVGTSTFEVSDAQANATVDVLVVAGGGSGGSSDSNNSTGCGGGGGAGGLLYESKVDISSSSYSIFVGDGGQSVSGSPGESGNNGEDSTAFGLTAIGGGGGGAGKDSGVPGKDGGSGGGAGNDTGGVGGSALQPTSTDGGFGNDGGDTNTSDGDMTAGGGGAGSPGETIDSGGDAGDGGSGLDYSDRFTAQFGEEGNFSGGGGGGVNTGGGGTGVPGSGGIGGGGSGGEPFQDGVAAIPNTGGGGGGAGDAGSAGASGGSGIVLIRYKL